MQILLFDIDGTLVNTAGAGAAALRGAFSALFGVEEPRDVVYSGRTDRAITRDMFALHDIEDSAANWSRLRDEYVARLADSLPVCPGHVLPGVSRLLAELDQRDDVVLGLLTGNVRQGARLKLEHFRLFHHFPFGGFGDEDLDRNHVAERALAEARQHVNGHFERCTVWVVGDTPLDIRCARWIGARVVAVSTGHHARGELSALAPDVLLDDLSDLDQLLSIF